MGSSNGPAAGAGSAASPERVVRVTLHAPETLRSVLDGAEWASAATVESRYYRQFQLDPPGEGTTAAVILVPATAWPAVRSGLASPPSARPAASRVLILSHAGDPPVSVSPASGCEVIDADAGPEAVRAHVGRAVTEVALVRRAFELEAESAYWQGAITHLNQIGIALSTERDLAQLLSLIVSKARDIICADAGSLYLVSPQPGPKDTGSLVGKRMRYQVTQNDSVEFAFRSAVLDIDKRTLYGYAALTQETVVLDDVYRIPTGAEYTWGGRDLDVAMGYRTKSLLAVPLVDWRGRTIGVLQLINRKGRRDVKLSASLEGSKQILPFSARDVGMAKSLASQASIAIQNALLIDSERRRLQGLVNAGEERFANLIEGSIQGIAIYRDLKPLFVNDAYAKTLGFANVPELLRFFSFDQAFPRYEATRLNALQEAQGGEAAGQHVYELPAIRRDRQRIWLTAIARGVVWENGPAVQVTIGDITSRKLAELKLKESEERFRNLVEGSIQGFVIHRQGLILFANEAMARIFGFSSVPGMLQVRNWNDVISPEDRARVVGCNQDRLAGRPAPTRYEFKGLRFNGGELWLEVVERVVDWDGSPAVQSTLSDITERKRADAVRQDLERQVLHRQKLESLGVLAGGLAHDFNNILLGILGNAELATFDLPPDGQSWRYVDQIVQAANRASNLTQQMLAYAGKGKVRIQSLDLNETVTAMPDLLRAAIPKNVQVDLRLGKNLPRVEGDSAQIEQVIMNLITNAAESFGEQGGTIRVTTSESDLGTTDALRMGLRRPLTPGRYVSIVVADSGCGMADDVKVRVFEPFFTTKFTGRGLGMSAVLGIVRAHKGAIDIESAQGVGTTVRVYLPVETQAAAAVRGRAAAGFALPPETAWGSVLVVDDEETVRLVLSAMLKTLGFKVETANSGAEALNRLLQERGEYRLIILDAMMPGLSPEQTFTHLRKAQPDVPVLLCSGFGGEYLLQRYSEFRISGFLQKPFQLAQLAAAVKNVLEPDPDFAS